MKRNLLFINFFWIFVAGLLGILMYVSTKQVGGVWVLQSMKTLVKALWVPALIALISLGCSIPLGRLPKKKSARIDCVLIQVLITVALVAIFEVLISSNKLSKVPAGFDRIFHYFIVGAVCGYLLGLSLVCIIKACWALIFKKLDDPKVVQKTFLLLTPTFIWGGVLTMFIRAKSLSSSGRLAYTSQYLSWVNKGVWILVVVLAIVMVVAHVLTSLKTKKGLAPVIASGVGFLVAFIMSIIIVIGKVSLSANFSHLVELPIFMVGSYFVPSGILLICYCIRPFVDHIGSDEFYLDNVISPEKAEEAKETVTETVEETPSETVEEVPAEQTEETPTETVEEVKAANEEEVEALKSQLESANEQIAKLEKELNEHINNSNIHSEAKERTHKGSNNTPKETYSDTDLSDESHYETELKTTITRGFKSKLIKASDDLKQTYSNLLNIAFKYKRGNVRHAFAKDSIVLGRTKVAVLKMSPSSKAMYLYLNLPASYLEINKYHLKDYTDKTKSLASTPYRLRIRSERSEKYALELLEAAYKELEAVEFKTPRETVDFTEDLGPQTEEQMIANGLIKKKVVEETYLVEPVYADEEVKDDEDEESDALEENEVEEDEE